ncbi:MAG: transposase [Planctomycetota bacterium]|nr:transposase [Planctomycetota bacterium]
MVIAYHAIFSTYGFWLPNDPRGSWSEFVGSWELVWFGRATKTDARHSVAGVHHDRRLRLAAKGALRHQPVAFSGRQALAVGRGFARACRESGYVVHACSILPEHVHMVIARHERALERTVGHLKGRATQRLKADGLWPGCDAPVWAKGCWRVYLNTAEDVKRAVAYVEANPEKESKPRQHWSFVIPYDG